LPLVRKGVFVRNMHIQNKPSNYSLRKAYSEKLRNSNKVIEKKSKKRVIKAPVNYPVKNKKTLTNKNSKKPLKNKNENTTKVSIEKSQVERKSIEQLKGMMIFTESINCGLVDQIKLDYDLLNGRLTSLKRELSFLSEQYIREKNEQLKFRELVWKCAKGLAIATSAYFITTSCLPAIQSLFM